MRPIAVPLLALALLAPGSAIGPTQAQRYVPVRPVPCCITHVGPGLNPAQLTPPTALRPAQLPMSLRADNVQGAPLYSLDPAAHPETRIDVPGVAPSTGQEIGFGDRRIVVKAVADAALASRALEYLGQVLPTPLTAVALLHPEQDAALLGRLRQAWGEADFVNPPPGEEAIAELFAAQRNRRLVLFGYLGGPVGASDGGDAQDNYAVFNPLGNPTTLPLSRVRQLAWDNEVEAVLVGTGWFGAGAGTASLGGVGQDELAAMLAAMRAARTRTELLAAVATPERPVLVDPARLVPELERGEVSVRRMGDERASAISVVRAQAAPAPPPPPLEEPPPDGGGEEENQQQPEGAAPVLAGEPAWWDRPFFLALMAVFALLAFLSWRR